MVYSVHFKGTFQDGAISKKYNKVAGSDKSKYNSYRGK